MGALRKVTKLRGESASSIRKIRLLAVDDSVLILRLLREIFSSTPDIDLVGVASNGVQALERIPLLNPDLVLLDVDMPQMDGLELLKQLQNIEKSFKIVMYSTLTERCAQITLKALALGADDYVPKGDIEGGANFASTVERAGKELLPKIRQFFETDIRIPSDAEPGAAEAGASLSGLPQLSGPPKLVVFVSSTGGPAALGKILPAFPAAFPVPLVLVQAMPPTFTALLAKQLNGLSPLEVRELKQGEVLVGGTAYVVPGGQNLRISQVGRDLTALLSADSAGNSARPSADVLLTSLANQPDCNTLVVALTGMGQDGLRGAIQLKQRGCTVLAQDEASSTVWDLAGALANAGIATQVLPLEQIAGAIAEAISNAQGNA